MHAVNIKNHVNQKMYILANQDEAFLARAISEFTNIPILYYKLTKFPDGELSITLSLEDASLISGQALLIVKNITAPIHDNFMEMLLLLDMLHQYKPSYISLVSPYLAYSRQDKSQYSNISLGLRTVLNNLANHGVQDMIVVDLHNAKNNLQASFIKDIDINIINLSPHDAFLPYIQADDNLVIIAPDQGSVYMAQKYQNILGAKFMAFSKKRSPDGGIEQLSPSATGEDFILSGKKCLIIDDIIDSAKTLAKTARILHKMGAESITAIATHGVFSGQAMENLQKSYIEKIYVSDSFPHYKNNLSDKIVKIDIAPVIAKYVQEYAQKQKNKASIKTEHKVT